MVGQSIRRGIIMRISGKAAVVAAIVTGVASLGAAGAAFASSSPSDTHHDVQVLRLRTVPICNPEWFAVMAQGENCGRERPRFRFSRGPWSR